MHVLDRPVKKAYRKGVARPRTFDEDDVLRAVAQRFWDRGYAATSLSDVMAASGLGKGSIYATFGDKDAIFRRAFHAYCSDVTAAVAAALEGPDDAALERLEALLTAGVPSEPGPDAPRACFLAKTTAELAAHHPDIAERSRQAFADLAGSITRCVVAAQRAGDIAPDADPVHLGHFVLVVLRGLEALKEPGYSRDALRGVATLAMATLTGRSQPGPTR